MEKSQKPLETSKTAPKTPEDPTGPSSEAQEKNAPESEKTALNAKITELTSDLQRTRADFENYRKNIEKDKENLKKLTAFSEVSKVLPLLDDFSRALTTYPELKPLEKNLQKTLKSLKLEPINTAPGTEFNPEFHEAVLTEGDGAKELISETLRPGYLYDGAVLRPAMVKVKLA
ncbi:nucleotide exchange factor GrpE [Candidatus Saccharibacteria bacterium]|nr:nucleotide exchange factor GrpE [Candidatus Saccharibacteria bacterium]